MEKWMNEVGDKAAGLWFQIIVAVAVINAILTIVLFKEVARIYSKHVFPNRTKMFLPLVLIAVAWFGFTAVVYIIGADWTWAWTALMVCLLGAEFCDATVGKFGELPAGTGNGNGMILLGKDV